MKSRLFGLGLSAILAQSAIAGIVTTTGHEQIKNLSPEPITCIAASFSTPKASQWYTEVNIKLTNNCGSGVDFKDAAITFINGDAISTSGWGNFPSISYPDSINLTSQTNGSGKYLTTINLVFPQASWSVTKLPAKGSIVIKFGINAAASYVANSAQVYLPNNSSQVTGSIALTNTTALPSGINQAYAVVNLALNGVNVKTVNLPWSGSVNVSGLSTGNYAVLPQSLTDSSDNTYQGNANPATVTVTANQTVNSNISYTQIAKYGSIKVTLPALPAVLAGYTDNPAITFTAANGTTFTQTMPWNATTTVTQLANNTSYTFSTPTISFNGAQCAGTFSPTSASASATSAPTTVLSYQCSTVTQDKMTINVSGAPSTTGSVNLTFTPNNNGAAIVQKVSLANGSGTTTVNLTDGVVYNVAADNIDGYSVTLSPASFTAKPNLTETVTYTQGITPVAINGQLKVCGTKLCNQNGQPIQLRGMSSHGLQWYGWGKCLTAGSLDALVNSFGANVIRLSMYVQEGGYETNPTAFTNQVNTLINEANKRGIYAIIDFHILTPGDPNYNLANAKKFFTDIATANKGKVNMLYEIANEPNGVSWSAIKSYAEQVIPVIRAIDPNTVIIVGTRGWSSLGVSDGESSQEIINNPVNASNIMYTFHFYAKSHRDDYLAELDTASNQLPIFVTEWGSQDYTGDGANDFAMTDKYIQLMANKQIGWTNWNYSDDALSGAIWNPGTCSKGQWVDSNLKASGVYVKAKIHG